MNTVKKGDDFEEKAYKLISKLLNNHQLGVVPAHCEVFKKKGYYSAKREKYIIFDLSIEVWPPGAKNYTFLYLIECKDYSGSVSVDRIESFDSKIRQIGDHNIKAVFITTSRLQEGGRALCEKMGVMLIRCGRNMTYDIILHRVGGKRPYRRNIETEEPYSFKTLKDVLLSEWTKAVDIKLLEAVSRLGSLYKISGTSVPVLSRKDIESLAIRILDNYSRNILRNSEVISIEPFIKYLSDAFDLKIIHIHIDQYDLSGRKILAKCNIKERIITIDLSVVNTIRYLFTLCHEFSHFLLHKNVVIKQSEYETVSDDFFKYKSKKDNLITDRDWVEWQANELAVNLILPEVPFKAKVSQLLGEMGRTIDLPFYLGHHYSNYKEYNRLLDNLSKHYHVSRTMISIRLNYFGLVHDQKNTKGLSNWGDSFDKVS